MALAKDPNEQEDDDDEGKEAAPDVDAVSEQHLDLDVALVEDVPVGITDLDV